jgi:hypothetical protein
MSGTIDFEAVVLAELNKAWHNNVFKFRWNQHKLLAPNFRIMEANQRWGQWNSSTRDMSFSRNFVSKRPWNEVLEVLKHEMAHQFVSEVLHLDNEEPHGPTFKGVCKKYNIDAAVRGAPGADKVTTTNHIVEKIQHLLKLAENEGATEAESQAAATAAHNLMLKYNIAAQEKNEERGYTIRYLGGVTGRIQAYMSEIANLLTKYYFVEIIWISTRDPRTGKDGNELEIAGTEENVEVAEYVHDFLSRVAVETWEKKFADPAFKLQLNQEFARGFARGTFSSPRGFNVSARSNFLTGFIQGYKAQLKQETVKEIEQGLILAKDTGLEEFYHQRHPHIRNRATSGGQYNSSVRGIGFAEGNALKIPSAIRANKTYTPLLGK